MAMRNLNHYLVVTDDLDATRAFYEDILGLRVGDRPPFTFPGLWIYLDDRPVVHVAQRDPGRGHMTTPSSDGPPTGAIDHIAFEASGYDAMAALLDARGIQARRRTVPDLGLRQIFVKDPNGIMIELNYPASE